MKQPIDTRWWKGNRWIIEFSVEVGREEGRAYGERTRVRKGKGQQVEEYTRNTSRTLFVGGGRWDTMVSGWTFTGASGTKCRHVRRGTLCEALRVRHTPQHHEALIWDTEGWRDTMLGG